MKLSYPLIALLIVGLFGTLFSIMIFDPQYTAYYSPNTSESSSYTGLFQQLNQSAEHSRNTFGDVQENAVQQDETTIFSVGTRIVSAIKAVGSLVNLGLITSLINAGASILGVPSVVASIIVSILMIGIVFAIIAAFLRWKA